MEKLTKGLVRLVQILSTFWKNLLYSAENYLRSKTKEIPNPAPRRRRQVIASIMARPAFQQFLATFARERGFSKEQVEANAHAYLEEIAADLNYLILPFWDTLLTWVFGGTYEGIVIDEQRFEEFRQRAGKKPIVFVPNHRSHMDYLLLSYIFYQQRVPLPHICAGTNLSFWPLGPIGRKSGAFFIRRSYEGNKLYAACVQAYVEELVRDHAVIEFFIEGTRSRSGKLLPPRMGMLSAIVQAFLNHAAEDILFVPVSLTYESVLEEKSYLAEQSGANKRAERSSDLVQLAKYLKKRSGKVYLQFGETISLQEWLQETPTTDKRSQVEELAFHLTHGINKSSVVTARSLVAASLLSHSKRVISSPDLSVRLESLIHYLRFKGCRFSGPLDHQPTVALQEAISNARERDLIEELRDEEGLFYLIPEEKRPLLDYYKNNSMHFFASLGVFCSLLIQQPKGRVPLTQLEDSYRFFQNLFRYEFTFSRRQPLREHLAKLLEFLEQNQAVRLEDNIVLIDSNHRDYLAQYAVLIRNFLEGYFILWKALPTLGIRRWEQKELIKWLLYKGHLLYLKDRIRQRESISRFVLQNSLLSFRDLGLIREEIDGWGKKRKIYYRIQEAPAGLIDKIEGLLTGKMT